MKVAVVVCIFLCLYSCGEPEPRKPVEVRTGSFMKQSVERNRELLSEEEKMIRAIIEKDSLNDYISSPYGFWYFYQRKNQTGSYTPGVGDLVRLEYNILSLDNDTIYSSRELGVQQYLVDREDKEKWFPGLRNSIKLLKEGETATFLYPSSLAFGYPGDRNKIGPNVPIKSTISLLKLEKQQDSITAN